MMKNKKAQSYTNVFIIILIVLITSALGIGFKEFGADLMVSDNANLNQESQRYISNELYGMNITYKTTTAEDKEDTPYLFENETQSNKDYSLEFQYSKDKSQDFWTVAFDIYNLPMILFTMFGITGLIPSWLYGIISTFLWILVTIGIYYIIRGLK